MQIVRFVTVLALVACGNKTESGATSSGSAAPVPETVSAPEAAFKKLSGFTDEMCACKDKACADDVTAKLTAYTTEMEKDPELRDAKKPDGYAQRMEATTKRYTDCAVTVIAAMRPVGSAKIKVLVGQMTRFVDEACACTDSACADNVTARLKIWTTESTSNLPPEAIPEVTAGATRFQECVATIGAASPSCKRYEAAKTALLACDKLPAELATAMDNSSHFARTESACTEAMKELAATAARTGCDLPR
jgi:hypothetical protein